MFGIRNAKRSLAKTPWLWATIFDNTRGRGIGSGRLPELRRFWICCEARGLEREVRWRRVYPDEVSRLRGQRPKAPYLAYDRRLTARPAVLAKRTEPDRHTSRPTVDGPAARNLPVAGGFLTRSLPLWCACAGAKTWPSPPDFFRWLSPDRGPYQPIPEPSRGWISLLRRWPLRCL